MHERQNLPHSLLDSDAQAYLKQAVHQQLHEEIVSEKFYILAPSKEKIF